MNILIISSLKGTINLIRPEAEIYIYLAKQGHNITILTQANSSYANKFLENNIKIINTDFNKKIDFSLIKKIKNIIKEEKITSVYATKSKEIANAVIACYGTKVKLITYRGTTGGLYRHDPMSYLNALNPRVNAVVAVSKAVEKSVKKQLLFKKTQVKTVYKAHNPEWYTEYQQINLQDFDVDTNSFKIAFVADVRKHKGLDIVIKAFNKINTKLNIKLIMAGKIPNNSNYLNSIKEKSKNNFIFLGYRKDVPSILASSDIFIHASTRKEGLPRVMMECLAVGTPIIASDLDCNTEIITNEFNGLLVEKNNPCQLYEAILKLYNNRVLLKRLKDNTKSIFNHEFSFIKNAQEFEKLLEA